MSDLTKGSIFIGVSLILIAFAAYHLLGYLGISI